MYVSRIHYTIRIQIQYWSFCVWLILISITFLKSIHVVAYNNILFLFVPEKYSLVCIHFFHPFTSLWTQDCLHLSAIVNSAAVNMGIEISVWVPAFKFFGYIPGRGISRSYGGSIFNILRSCLHVSHEMLWSAVRTLNPDI